jgi:hypothetical protein
MKRWYVFFLVVAILTGLASLGIFSGSVQQQTAGLAGPGKLLFLTLLALGGVAFAGWLAFSSSRKRQLGSGNDDRPSQERKPEWPAAEQNKDTLRSR